MCVPFFLRSASVTAQELKSFVLGEAIMEGKLMYIQVIDFTAPAATGIFGIAHWLFGRAVVPRQIVALFLIFFQASFFAILLINNKAYNDSTYVPALVFGILCFFSFDLLCLRQSCLPRRWCCWR